MKRWLIKNSELKEITNDYEWDWVLGKFRDNGITTPEDAYWCAYVARFEYTNVDCPFCEIVDNHYELNSELWKCKNCAKNFTITSKTYIDNSKLEYYHWWRFAYLIGELKITNSCLIARDLEVTQKTSWGMIETVKIARKETTSVVFKNGHEVLKFDNSYNIMNLLLKIRKQNG